jgi:Ser/Thr protein kinase RdoA (MazF antagonist)
MMTLSTMKKVVETVNSEWRSSLAEEILERWGYDHGSVYYFRASANFLFLFKINGKSYFLRFIDSVEKDFSSIESEIKLLNYLRSQPIKVALPVESLNGHYVETVKTDWGTFYAVVFEALPGKQFETEELENDQFYKWGSSLGELHTVFKTLPDEFRKTRKNGLDQLEALRTLLPESELAAIHEWEQVFELAKGLPQSEENFGLIHFDFELDNQRWDDDVVGILDFDDSLNNWYAADIAFALRDLFKEGIDLENEAVQCFLDGYRSKTSLDNELLHQLPLFMRMHNLITFTGLLRTVDIPASEDHPEWLRKLSVKLLNYIDHYRSTFQKK